MSDNTDFNDMAALYGEAEVARVINAAFGAAINASSTTPITAPTANDPSQRQSVTFICAADIVPEAINWLWDGWLAAGKFHILGGAPGTGKTTLALAFAATVSSGGCWPDGTTATAGNVLIWSGEDDPANTLVPRLIAAGANRSKVRFVSDTVGADGKQPFDPSKDIAKLSEAAQTLGNVRLLIVDPIVSAVKGDANSNGDTRKGLQPLVDLGATLNCAVIGITHFSKGTVGRETTERVIGSIAFAALARVVLVAAKSNDVAEGEPSRILMRSKSNIGSDGGGFAYDLTQIELLGYRDIAASYVAWGRPLEGSAREILADAEGCHEEGGSALGDACVFLRDLLDDGAVDVKDIRGAAKNAGVTWATVRRAKKKLKIKTFRETFKGGWSWRLPEGEQQNANTLIHKSSSTLANVAHLGHKTGHANAQSEIF
jgi:putative DNA primase/helicase